MDYEKRDDFRVAYSREKNFPNPMVDSQYFKTSYLELDRPLTREFKTMDSFRVYVCVGGCASLELGSYSVKIEKGETALIPAASPSLRILAEDCRLLEVTL
jgi:mannose-6-phosphate isomerase